MHLTVIWNTTYYFLSVVIKYISYNDMISIKLFKLLYLNKTIFFKTSQRLDFDGFQKRILYTKKLSETISMFSMRYQNTEQSIFYGVPQMSLSFIFNFEML